MSKKVWSKLSPTPKELFCLDFLLRKDEQKLYRQKLLIFSKTFLVFEFSGHSGRHVIFRCFLNHVCVEMIEQIEEENVFSEK